jgi:thiol-disulfide isomerase/thioredoxin
MQSTSSPQRLRNFAIVTIAIVLAIALALGVRAQKFTDSLEAQATRATPIDLALSNGKPTLMEFYANWCTSCQAMAADLATVKTEFGDRVNFSMLNVDNTKWLPEVTKYRVDGIPHFVFFDDKGQVLAQAIGEQPRQILESKLTALVAGAGLSDSAAVGEVSKFTPKVVPSSGGNDDPRAHGA